MFYINSAVNEDKKPALKQVLRKITLPERAATFICLNSVNDRNQKLLQVPINNRNHRI